MTKPVVTDYFYADPTSPSGVLWKVSRYGHNNSTQIAAGDVAGTVSKSSGYWQVRLRLDGILHHWQAHRLLWELVYGYVPDEVDHKDGNRTNNTLSNLREVSAAINARNRVNGHKKQYAAPTGVSLQESADGTARQWIATWYPATGQRARKAFSVAALGESGAFEAACSYREARMEEIKNKLGYTERHGGK